MRFEVLRARSTKVAGCLPGCCPEIILYNITDVSEVLAASIIGAMMITTVQQPKRQPAWTTTSDVLTWTELVPETSADSPEMILLIHLQHCLCLMERNALGIVKLTQNLLLYLIPFLQLRVLTTFSDIW